MTIYILENSVVFYQFVYWVEVSLDALATVHSFVIADIEFILLKIIDE